MNISNPIVKHALHYGLVLGVTLSIFELVSYFLGIIGRPIIVQINIVLVLSSLIIGLRKYREQLQDGVLPFGQAFLAAFLICVFSSIILAFYRYIEFMLAPEIATHLIELYEDNLLQGSLSEDTVELLSQAYRVTMTPGIHAFSTIFSMSFWGALLSLILAGFFKRTTPTNIAN